jgi:hypothetical protein
MQSELHLLSTRLSPKSIQQVVETAALVFLLRFLAVEARLEQASRRGEVTVFRPVLFLRLLFGFAVPTLLYGTSQIIKSRDWLIAAISFSMAMLIFLNWPGTIFINGNEIRETRWLGLKRTRISWADVVYAGGDLENRVTVRSKDDHVISHTAYHVDRYGFIEALKRYCPQCSYNQRAEGPQPGPWVPLGSP